MNRRRVLVRARALLPKGPYRTLSRAIGPCRQERIAGRMTRMDRADRVGDRWTGAGRGAGLSHRTTRPRA